MKREEPRLRLAATLPVRIAASLVLSASTLVSVNAGAQGYEPSPPIYQVRAETDQYVASGGTQIQVDVYRPDAPGRFPVIVWFDVYYKDDPTGPVVNAERNYFVSRGFVFVHGSSPGSNNSGGSYENAFGPKEQQAAYDVVEWAAVQSWSTGEVAMEGLSYAAIIEYFVAAKRPPHLVTIYPASAYSDLYRDIVYIGGNLQAGYPIVWDAKSRSVAHMPPLSWGNDPVTTTTNYGAGVAGFRPVLGDFLQHPYADDFYAVRSPIAGNPRIDIPVAIDVGWFDDMVYGGPINFETVGSSTKRLVIGPWGHSETHRRPGGREERLRWFDFYLKGLPSGVDTDPRVRIFVPQGGSKTVGEWWTEDAWPIARTTYVSKYLGSQGSLSDQPPTAEGSASYLYSPTRQSEIVLTVDLGESVRFETAPLAAPIDVVGYPEVVLYGSTDARDTSWNVALYDVAPDGKASLLQRGWLRAAARELDESRSMPGRPHHLFQRDLPVPAGQVLEYRIPIWPTANRFTAGHRIRIVISDSTSGQGAPALLPPYIGTNSVHFGGAYPSRLILPVVPTRD